MPAYEEAFSAKASGIEAIKGALPKQALTPDEFSPFRLRWSITPDEFSPLRLRWSIPGHSLRHRHLGARLNKTYQSSGRNASGQFVRS